MEFKDRDGRVIDFKAAGFSEAQMGVLGTIIGASVSGGLEALGAKLASSVGASIDTKLKPLGDELAALKAAAPTKKDEPPRKDGDGGVSEAIAAAIKPLTAPGTALAGERKAEREQRESRERAAAWVAKNYPNFRGREVLIARLAATNPKDDEAVRTAFEAFKAEQIAIVGEAFEKSLSAKPEGEGAKPPEKDADAEAAKKAKIEELRKRGANAA